MILNLTLKVRPFYTCLKCSREQIGTDTYTITDISSIANLNSILTKYKVAPPVQGIPVGWSSAGSGRVYCEGCK